MGNLEKAKAKVEPMDDKFRVTYGTAKFSISRNFDDLDDAEAYAKRLDEDYE